MRKITTLLILLFALKMSAQLTFSAPVAYWTGVPIGAPSVKGSRIAVDLLNNKLYQWNPVSSAWYLRPEGITVVSGCSVPAYTPGAFDNTLAINNCTPTPELYSYFAGSWHQAGGGATYTAGTGIDISGGNVISNTGVLTSTNAGGDVSGTFSNLQITNGAVGGNEISWPLLAPGGSLSAPSYSFSNYPGSGLYQGSKLISLVSSGDAVLTIRSQNDGSNGKNINIITGTGPSGTSGNLAVSTGLGSAGGGNMTFASANATTASSGLFSATTGSTTTGVCGNISFIAGSTAGGTPGKIILTSGSNSAGGGQDIDINAGSGSTSGGSSKATAGSATAINGFGGVFQMNGGSANNTGGIGGQAQLKGGSGNAKGGDVLVAGGGNNLPQKLGKVVITGTGMVPPVLTTAIRDLLTGVSYGTFIINSTTNTAQWWNGVSWVNL